MTGIMWNALMNAPNPGQAFMDSFNHARDQKRRDAIEAEDRAWQREQRTRQRGEWHRADETRSAKSGMLMGGMNALMAAPTGPVPLGATSPGEPGAFAAPGGPMPRQYSPDAQRLIQADPDAFLTFQGNRIELTGQQLKTYRDLNDTAMQLLGGVNDQASYDLAKDRALQLYSSNGHDASDFFAKLPAEYSPEVIEGLRLQGMDTAKQMQAIARENRLDWDMEDDRLDNARADSEARSRNSYRSERLEDFDRAETGRRSRSRGGGRRSGPTPTSVIGRIMDKQAKGQTLSAAERQTLDEHRRGRGRGPRSSEAVAVGPNGRKIVVRGGKWVDAATGKPVQ